MTLNANWSVLQPTVYLHTFRNWPQHNCHDHATSAADDFSSLHVL